MSSSADPTWTEDQLVDPHGVEDKAKRVEAMFSSIAKSYDLNNRLHSLGRDQAWRRAAVAAAAVHSGDTVLDVAAGTGDLSLAFSRSGAGRVLGVDFTFSMLALAQKKPSPHRPVTPSYHAGDALRLPLIGCCADVVSIAFGIRNVADPGLALREFFRVMRPGGRLVILEFAVPENRWMRRVYNVYFHHIMPRTASWIARDHGGAYRYLPKSVGAFIEPLRMKGLIEQAGFVEVSTQPLTLGVALIYRAIKPG